MIDTVLFTDSRQLTTKDWLVGASCLADGLTEALCMTKIIVYFDVLLLSCVFFPPGALI